LLTMHESSQKCKTFNLELSNRQNSTKDATHVQKSKLDTL
jgi:hypothetical protein